MTSWEYSSLLAYLSWEHETPGDATSPWTAPTTVVTHTDAQDAVRAMGDSPHVALNQLGAEGWEVYAVDTDKALFDPSGSIPIKNSGWVRRTFWLKRELATAGSTSNGPTSNGPTSNG